MNEVTLTDDEAVAIAAERKGRWMGPLPTVDERDATALLQAAVRGERSLRVRGVDVDDSLISPVISRLPRVVGYVSDHADLGISGVICMAFQGSADADQTVLTVTTPDGVTKATSTGHARARDFFRGLSDGVETWSGSAPRSAVLLFPQSHEGGDAVIVTPTRSTRTRYSTSEGIDQDSAVDTTWADELAERL